ncbi:HalOD1 output domain-containing protein [Natrinema halophilum]|uniref:Halobacterial output domain-containing protein n=1 Tax=Natrinema halophilum TaxID=1699371 RepID=A0A7D5KBT2_9EURY|nr:HalOD1 output domain-containing protein [Natrinema halophilum]QLG47981.1 hypothetical protein HYG82_03545 [Natrinema halophilum]
MSSDSDSSSHPTFEHTYDDETPVSTAIIQAVCAVENVDPVDAPADLGFTLYEHVDPEALDRIVKENPDSADVQVELLVAGYDGLIRNEQVDVQSVRYFR